MARARLLLPDDYFPRFSSSLPVSPLAIGLIIGLGVIVFIVSAIIFYFWCYRAPNQQQPQPQAPPPEVQMVELPPLPSTIYDQTVNGDGECAICYDPFLDEQSITILPCRHFFHEGCTAPWRSHANCPMCRGDF